MAKRPLKRIFRIWDEDNKLALPHRCYKTAEKAINKALVLAKWDLPMHGAYTIYNDNTGHVEYQIVKRIINGETALVERK